MINRTYITIKSSWGYDINNLFLVNTPKSESVVILFPGADYSCDRPQLHYARKATLLSGCDVLSLEYGCFKVNEGPGADAFERLVKECYEAVELCLRNSYKNIYFISKSLGTSVEGEISKLIGYDKVNNLFLTPTPNTIGHILNSSCSIVVGTRDKYFTKTEIEAVANPSVKLHVIEGAVHSLEIDDDYRKSIQILSDVTNICADFVKESQT